MELYEKYLPAIDRWVEAHREEYIQDLSRVIAIESVAVESFSEEHVFGDGCAEVVDTVLQMAADYGMEAENDEYYCASAILRGREKRELCMVGHLDVVPAGEGWDFPPFKATVRDGQLIGRGSVDNKGATMAAMYALRCLRELGVPLNHSVRLLMGCQEESGMKDIPHFLEKHADHLPELFLVCDCAFPIHYGEKGIVRMRMETDVPDGNLLSFAGGTAPNSIPEHAKALIKGVTAEQARAALAAFDVSVAEKGEGVEVSARGVAGHAASPEQGTESAIAKLAQALSASGLLTGATRRAVDFLALALVDYYGSGLGIAYGDEMSGKNTSVGGMVRLENGRLSQSLNVRCAITADMDALVASVRRHCEENGFSLTLLDKSEPLYIPLDSMNGLPMRLAEKANELLDLGGLPPAVLPGGTHARLLPNAIGYGPNMPPEIEFKKKRFGSPHGANEAVIINDMMQAIRAYAATWIWLDELPDFAGGAQ